MLFQNGGCVSKNFSRKEKGSLRKVSTKEKKMSVENNQPIQGCIGGSCKSSCARVPRTTLLLGKALLHDDAAMHHNGARA